VCSRPSENRWILEITACMKLVSIFDAAVLSFSLSLSYCVVFFLSICSLYCTTRCFAISAFLPLSLLPCYGGHNAQHSSKRIVLKEYKPVKPICTQSAVFATRGTASFFFLFFSPAQVFPRLTLCLSLSTPDRSVWVASKRTRQCVFGCTAAVNGYVLSLIAFDLQKRKTHRHKTH
jgi:hypothetical protein